MGWGGGSSSIWIFKFQKKKRINYTFCFFRRQARTELSNWQELGKGGTRGCDDQKNKNYWERLRSNMCNKKKEQRIISNKKNFFYDFNIFFFQFQIVRARYSFLWGSRKYSKRQKRNIQTNKTRTKTSGSLHRRYRS